MGITCVLIFLSIFLMMREEGKEHVVLFVIEFAIKVELLGHGKIFNVGAICSFEFWFFLQLKFFAFV